MDNLAADPTFDPNGTEKYNLSIQVSLDGFSFSVTNPTNNRLVAFLTEPAIIHSEVYTSRRFFEWIDKHSLLTKKFHSVRIIYPTIKYQVVPGEYYDFEKQKSLTEFMFVLPDKMKIIDNYIPSIEANVIFSIPQDLHQYLSERYPQPLFFHPVSSIVSKLDLNRKEAQLALHFCNSQFFMLLFDNGKLIISNSYRFTHPNDIIYHLLTGIKLHDISIRNTILWLSGSINLNDDRFSALSRHFENISFMSPEIQINDEQFPFHPHHYSLIL